MNISAIASAPSFGKANKSTKAPAATEIKNTELPKDTVEVGKEVKAAAEEAAKNTDSKVAAATTEEAAKTADKKSVKQTVDEAAQKTKKAAGEAGEKVKKAAGEAAEKTKEVAGKVAQKAGEAKRTIGSFIKEHKVLAAIVGTVVAILAALGIKKVIDDNKR
ncbi:MAG: hypothetical protein IJW73_01460 [Candidatus Gastranaerophilales bacterium]|nr:hypothetical protein [Candidatus Gastranaerophilales bacterium]